ncbi:GNAT family N-acetyltransferase [Myroides odoratimimus]|uniref:GNAT family N-acetyltransferase n=1 Tax=Myroides odoratimimus TaxID=76832 RepID=UPI0025775DB8|nr:GNAT family N-acetyltransferase [Myroides odoratimimus]MDM1527401.1 GNAT family N-acetyltransferase [Myroides odoratimimus]
MQEVEFLEWDSKFFGYKIGKLECSLDFNSEFNCKKDYDLVYLFSPSLIQEYKDYLVDQKCVLRFNCLGESIEALKFNENIVVESFDFNKHSYESLLELVFESGVQSRFKTDSKFSNEHFKSLYKKWIDNSLNKDIAIDTIVALEGEKIVGFLTYGEESYDTAKITLTAVDSSARGKKVASSLINEFKKRINVLGYTKANVVTQFDNLAAMRLYQKNGFNISKITYIYHIWNNDTI